ncbi:MAG: elongation factor G [Myxococcota bacterium]
MARYAPSEIRNVVLVGHGGCGKTSLAEALLYLSGATTRLGSTQDHTSILDFEPEEQKRQGSIATSLAWLEHEGHKINLLDTPGDQNFIYDAFNAIRGADAVILVVSAPDGVEVQTERVFHEARRLNLPVAFFINKMDRDRADADSCLQDIAETLGVNPVPLQLPLNEGGELRGLLSLLQRKAYVYRGDGSGQYDKQDLSDAMADDVEGAWLKLVETVAETDEALLETYLETFELSDAQVRGAFTNALKRGEIVPVLFGSATRCIGGAALLELITWAFPSPLERAPISAIRGDDPIEITPTADGTFLAQVIRTVNDEFSGKTTVFRVLSGQPPADGAIANASKDTDERLGGLYTLRGKDRTAIDVPTPGDILAVSKLKVTDTGDTLASPGERAQIDRVDYPPPMMSYIIEPTSKGSEGKLKIALERMQEEDPTLSTSFDDLTNHIILQGMGQAHLDMAVERMRRKYKVTVETDLPPVPYRETIKQAVTHVEGKHKKQTGGAGQFGVCYLNVSPLPSGEGFAFVDRVSGGAIPRTLIPSIEKGIRNRMKNGFLAGYPIVDVQVEVTDGKYHPVDSKDVAFQMAGSKGLRAAFEKAGTRLLEPIYEMEVVVPNEVMGDIMGDITARRGRVMGMDTRGKNTIIKAMCPLAEIQRYAPDLKSMSGGKGTFTMTLSGYESVPNNLIARLVAASPFRRDDDD